MRIAQLAAHDRTAAPGSAILQSAIQSGRAGKPIRLRFAMKDAVVCSFQLHDQRGRRVMKRVSILRTIAVLSCGSDVSIAIADEPNPQVLRREDALLYRTLAIPEQFLITRKGHTLAVISAIGDIDGRDELLTGYHLIDNDGRLLWKKKLQDGNLYHMYYRGLEIKDGKPAHREVVDYS